LYCALIVALQCVWQALKSNIAPAEKELVNILTVLSLSIKENDLICNKKGTECNGGCIRRLFVKHLRLAGCDAAICSSKWANSGKLPGGMCLIVVSIVFFLFYIFSVSIAPALMYFKTRFCLIAD
jgi:hypothetical protein